MAPLSMEVCFVQTGRNSASELAPAAPLASCFRLEPIQPLSTHLTTRSSAPSPSRFSRVRLPTREPSSSRQAYYRARSCGVVHRWTPVWPTLPADFRYSTALEARTLQPAAATLSRSLHLATTSYLFTPVNKRDFWLTVQQPA